ncbi:DNA-directed RNA polymerase subunit P [Candidatus Micrarchaeota archaeon]|nr:MAG: DNA-directed RNA polymerase subunit P [Candidatus Micrarchaeota archaeon]
MTWKCFRCGKKIDDINAVKCPYCGYRILIKERPPIAKKLRTD